MATRQKSVEYWFPTLLTAADNTITPFTQITLTLPEDGKVFRSVVLECIVCDPYTTATNITNRRLDWQLQGAAADFAANVSTLTQSAENFSFLHSQNLTSYFVDNWGANTTRTFDVSILVNTSPLGSHNITAKLTITYDYDDASTSHVKTVWIPLDAPIGALPTAKPGAANLGTIPALDTYLPEASKTILQTCVVIQGNTEGNSTTDKTLNLEVGTAGALTSALYEHGTNVDIWYRLAYTTAFATNTTHDVFAWASIADFDHPQAWLVVTYTFDPATTTRAMQSLWLPVEFGGPFGGTAAGDAQRVDRELWIQEPGTITTHRLAGYVNYDQLAAIGGLNARMGTGAYSTRTSVATNVAGNCGFMVRNDAAVTLARGRNTISLDVYRTDTSDLGYTASAIFLVNYSSDIAASGIGAHNRTIRLNLTAVGVLATAVQRVVTPNPPTLPESRYFFVAIGAHYAVTSNQTGNPAGVHLGVERLAAEGGHAWENVYEALGGTDPEVGIRQSFAQARSIFRRWDGDTDTTRLLLQTSRRWRMALGNNCRGFHHLDLLVTYHSITYPVTGDVSGSAGGTVTLTLHRTGSGERVLSTSRVGNGSYTLDWYDNTEQVYVSARESGVLLGRSDDALAGT